MAGSGLMDNFAIYAKEQKDIPAYMKENHDWRSAVDVNKLPKMELKVKMCCAKCEEKIIEETSEVEGVFAVKPDRDTSKVIVVGMPNEPKRSEVLRKAKKIHKKAKFVEPKPDAKKGGAKGGAGGGDAKKDEKKDEKPKEKPENVARTIYVPSYYIGGGHPGQQYPGDYRQSYLGEYRPSQHYGPRVYSPPPVPRNHYAYYYDY